MCYHWPMEKTDVIAILGYGVEGRAMLEYLLEHGYTNLTVCDQSEKLTGIHPGVQTRLGENYLQNLDEFDVVFRSPGISFFRSEIQEIMDSHTVISSMTKYFFEHCRAPIIGVTGTKGKGTTASLITEILRRDGKKVFLGGNIGVPAVSFLDDVSEDSFVVLELSSFQLVDLEMSPHIAVVLNVTSDHMDYHSSVEEYHESKYPIMAYQSAANFAVLNQDYPYATEFGVQGEGTKLYVSCKQFMINGAWVADQKVRAIDIDDVNLRERGWIDILDVSEIGLVGRHNWENVLPAVTVGRILEVPHTTIAVAVREFHGLPHRLEKVIGAGNIEYYNDSFSTTPESCLAACTAFNDMEKPFYVLAGGSEKGSDFTALGWKLSQMKFLQKVFVMGPSGVRIGEALTRGHKACVEDGTVCRLAVPVEHTESLREAVTKAHEEATMLDVDGTVILMSPAAASFNEFANYKERGEYFKTLARELMGR